jgi:hypothetical protein
VVGPSASDVLRHATGKGDETTAVHVDQNRIDLFELLGFVWKRFIEKPEPFFVCRFILQVKQFMVQDSDFNLESTRLANVRVLIIC